MQINAGIESDVGGSGVVTYEGLPVEVKRGNAPSIFARENLYEYPTAAVEQAAASRVAVSSAGPATELGVRRLNNRMAIDDGILGVWQSQGDLSEYIVFQADGTYRMVIPGVPALGTPDSVQAEGRFTTDCAKKPPHLDLAVGREWQFFIYEIHGDELRLDGAHDAAACLPSSRPTSLGTEARRFSRVPQGQTKGRSR